VKVVFLTLDEILALHADQIDRYGGNRGIRDVGLLRSALATPAATFGDRYLHGSLHEMAAAHLFHLVQDHPFVDGNKRIGLMAMLAFLGLNRLRLESGEDDLLELVLGTAEGRITKAEIAVFLQTHVRPRRCSPSPPRGLGRPRGARIRYDPMFILSVILAGTTALAVQVEC
jgi:death-on-curing protein